MALRADFLIVDSGFVRLAAYLDNGDTGKLAYVSFGDRGRTTLSGYVPQVGYTALIRERLRAPIMSGEVHDLTDSIQVSLAAYTTATDGFWCNEIGLHFNDGTLFALGSRPEGFFYVNPGEERLVTIETGFKNIPTESIALTEAQPNFVLFQTAEQLNYTISTVNLTAWQFGLEADAAIARIATMKGTA